MSVEIEYATTVKTKEEIIKKSEEMKKWVEESLNQKWTPMSYGNPEAQLFDQPQKGCLYYLMCKSIFNCNSKKVYDHMRNCNFEQQKEFDTDILIQERDISCEEEQCEIVRCAYKMPWPVYSREFVSIQNWYEKDGSYYFVQESVNYPNKWSQGDKNYVRAYKRSVQILKTIDDKKFEMIRIMEADARGSIPGWLANYVKKGDADRLLFIRKFFENKFPN